MNNEETKFLKEMDVFELKKGDKVYVENFPKQFLCDNNDFDFTLTDGELRIGNIQGGLDTSIFEGKYVVTKTTYDRGKNEYKGGYHVFAKKITNDIATKEEIISDFEISFYQSGSFTCMLRDRKPIGTAKPLKKIYIKKEK